MSREGFVSQIDYKGGLKFYNLPKQNFSRSFIGQDILKYDLIQSIPIGIKKFMISISSKAIYGLAAMVELASVINHAQIQSKVIAEKQGIPAAYLEQLLNELKRGGFVKSFRGAQGGYVLARPAAEITVKDIVTHLEGPILLVEADAKRGTTCCFWRDVETKLYEVFDVSLESVMLSQQRQQKVISYSI